jgi:hypothetical protein
MTNAMVLLVSRESLLESFLLASMEWGWLVRGPGSS